MTTFDVKTELFIGGAWTDITRTSASEPGILARDSVVINRGRRDENSSAEKSTCTATVNNRDGRYSPRNPTGPYYGLIGRNTPFRTYENSAASSWLEVPILDEPILTPLYDSTFLVTLEVSTPDNAALDITGDIDLRAEAWLYDWYHENGHNLIQKAESAGQLSYALVIDGGRIEMWWTSDGTNWQHLDSTVRLPQPAFGRKAVRATLDVNNGAAGKTATFYYSDSIDGTWTQLGDAVTTAGTTSIFSSTSKVRVAHGMYGRFYKAEIRSSIGGTAVANPDFTTQTDGATSFADAAGRTWTVVSGARINKREMRFHGEVSEWPQKWDPSGTDVYVPLSADGILRRIAQGETFHSPYYRGTTQFFSAGSRVNQLVAYWPMEDPSGSTSFAGAFNGSLKPMKWTGSPSIAASEVFEASEALPIVGSASFTGVVPPYTSTGNIQLSFLINVPAGGMPNNTVIARISCGGSALQWDLVYTTGGALTLNAYDIDGALLMTSGAGAFGLDGILCRVKVILDQDGADVDWTIGRLTVGDTVTVQTSGTLTTDTVTVAKRISINPNGAAMTDVVIGHVLVQNVVTDSVHLASQIDAHRGETAGDRIVRLCEEEGVSCLVMGSRADTAPMGIQGRDSFLNILRECESTDGGVLFEPREFLGLVYRTRESLYSQSTTLTLDYDGGDLSGIEPLDDDQYIKNDVTVNRRDGSSARAFLDEGTLSIEDFPDGVGRYPADFTLNLESDNQLPDHANWRMRLGTVDETRYPFVSVNLARTNFTGNATKTAAVKALDVADKFLITDPPAWLPPDDIQQLAFGLKETLNAFEWTVELNGVPATPYQVAIYDDDVSRYSGYGTTLNEALDTTETGIDVLLPAGIEWGHNDGDYDVITGGEVMTVTAVGAPSGGVQTLTVTRSVNGVVKSHASGQPLDLLDVRRYAL